MVPHTEDHESKLRPFPVTILPDRKHLPYLGTWDWKATPKSSKVIPEMVQEISNDRRFLRMTTPYPQPRKCFLTFSRKNKTSSLKKSTNNLFMMYHRQTRRGSEVP